MKVGLVCPYDITRGGGVQECVLAMQKELTANGHKVKIISPTPPGSKNAPPKNHIFLGSATKIKSPFHTSAEVSVSANPETIRRVLADEQFDVLHFHEPWVPVLSRQLLARSSAINVATFHAKLPETVMTKTIERVITPYTRSVLKNIDSLTAVSNAAAEFVRSLTDRPVVIVPNGIDLKKYQASITIKKPTAKKGILYIGRLEKRKGVKYLLKAFSDITETYPDVWLTIAGDGPDRQKLEDLAKNLGIKRIKFLGRVSEKQKLKLLKEALIFVSPALFGESFGIVLLEAMATGAVIVAGNNAGYAGVLTDRGTLSLVNSKDTKQFSRKLEIMLNDEEIRKLWLSWADEYVRQFDYPLVVQHYQKIYEKLHGTIGQQKNTKTTKVIS